MNHLHGTCRSLIPSKSLGPLSCLDGIGNTFHSHLAGGLANRMWSWKLHMASQSPVNCTSSKRNGLISPLQFPPLCCHSFKTHMAVQWTRLMRTAFHPASELLTPVSAVQLLELAPQKGKEQVAGKKRDFSATWKSYISFSQQQNIISSLMSSGNQAKD